MKKRIITLAVAAGLVASAGVASADPKVYGNVHLSINAADNDVPNASNNIQMSSNTSAIGVKGSEDLGGGMKAIYKLEFQVDLLGGPDTTPDSGAPNSGTGVLTGRDQWVGLKAGWGKLAAGTMSSNYKQTGGKVDPLYRTPLEGRGFLDIQSSTLHGGRGINRGRQTNTIQYTTPKMAGIDIVANYTLSGSEEETGGIGIRWSNKAWLLYADFISGQTGDITNNGVAVGGVCDTTTNCSSESAYKVGGKWTGKAFVLGAQYEAAEDRTGFDYGFLAGTWNVNKKNQLILTAGQQMAKAQNSDSTGFALAYNYKMSKMTNTYIGYGGTSSDIQGADEAMFTLGIRKKF